MPDSRKRLADAAFLLALMIYILSGTPLVPFHADEAMQIAMAQDYFTLREGNFAALAYAPPVEVDSLQFLRLINGSLNKNLIGLLWEANGRTAQNLPGIYAWAMPYEWNQQQGNVPDEAGLHVARWGSALATALGVIPIFMLGWHLRLRSLAYPAALIYALHPVILLNGRRAMMEGTLILFTLLSLYWLVALIVAEHSATARGFMKRLPMVVRYGALGVLLALTVSAKQTGVVTAFAVVLAVFAARLTHRPFQPIRAVGWVFFMGGIALVAWFGLNPQYWNNPVGAVRATVDLRLNLLRGQATNGPLTHATTLDRIGAILTQPFLTPPQYAEAPDWERRLAEPISAYQVSATNGWDWGPLIGGLFTALAALGLVVMWRDARKRDLIAWAILLWGGTHAAFSLTVPLNWQRYYLPLLLVGIVLAAEGLGRLLVRRDAPAHEAPPAELVKG